MLPTPDIKDLDFNVYEPSEDSFLLLDCFEEEDKFLKTYFEKITPFIIEVGTGSGIVTSFIMSNILPDSIFLTTDVNPHATKTCRKTIKHNNPQFSGCFDALQMSLTTGIRKGLVDILVFNPPYVPAEEVPEIPDSEKSDTWLDLALLGGSDGMVVTWELLNNLGNILSEKGIAYILFCARNKPLEVQEVMKAKGWNVDIVISRKAGWEVLSILKFYR